MNTPGIDIARGARARGVAHARRRSHGGFTLIELMITVAVVAILIAVAFPSYEQYLIRTNRSAAQAVMLDIANREQQFFMHNRSYADKDALETSGFGLPKEVSDHYGYAIDVVNAPPRFTITFTPITGKRQAKDGPLGLTSAGEKSPSEKW